MTTVVRRMDLSAVQDIETDLQNLCANMDAGGYRLVTSFAFGNNVVLIFQQ